MRHRRQPARLIVRRTTALLAVMGAAAAATVVAAGPSSAATSPTSATALSPTIAPTSVTAYGPGGKFGYAHFDAMSQVLSIHDSHADGYGIQVANWRYDLADTGPYYGYNRDGSGTTTYYQLHMPDLGKIDIRVCGEQDGIAIWSDCGTWVTGYAGVWI